jgi:hypothetical protein
MLAIGRNGLGFPGPGKFIASSKLLPWLAMS